MATRSDRDLKNALIVTRTVEAGQSVAIGRTVKDGNADKEVQHAGAGEAAIGVVVALGALAGAAGDKVQVALLCGACIIPVKLGTNGGARGAFVKTVADGVTAVTATATATTPVYVAVHGYLTQTGVAGDIVGMVPAPSLTLEE